MKPDHAKARRLLLWARACDPIDFNELVADSYHHDHDEELGMYWFNNPPTDPAPNTQDVACPTKASVIEHTKRGTPPIGSRCSSAEPQRSQRPRDEAYWDETARLVLDYFQLQAGAFYSETLKEGFIAWLKRSPPERWQYEAGDDMLRADLVDWYLKVMR